jgi:DNA-directed RNA polymerase subunit RPC12/RpoP
VASSNTQPWRVALRCPQCGGPIDLEESSRLFACAYCRVRLFLDPGETPRYYLVAKGLPAEEPIYAPYWRYQGLFFFLAGSQVEGAAVDANLLALPEGLFLPSLGLRPQTQTLSFVSPKIPGRFLKPAFDFHEAAARLESRFLRVSQALQSTQPSAFVGETISLIYAPFLRRGRTLRDLLPSRPTEPGPIDIENLDRLESEAQRDWTPAFLPALCPKCGWDLEGDEKSRVLNCPTCGRLWQAARGRYQEVEAAALDGGADGDLYLPFWRIQPEVDGLPLRTYADLARLANLPRAELAAWQGEPFHFLVPAFLLPPRLFLRLTRQMTLYRPGESFEPIPPGRVLHPVSLPLSQAAESLALNLGHLSADKRDLAETLAGVRVRLGRAALLYVPFSPSGPDLVHAAGRIGVSRVALLRERNF